nr:CopG family transcriptional regulator [Roseomonas sp. GC11]
MGKDGRDAHRVSVTLSKSQHDELARIARKQGMTVAWLVRRAAERLIEQENGGPMLPLMLDPQHAQR